MPGEPADNVDCPPYVFLLVTFDLTILRAISCHCEIVPTINKCVEPEESRDPSTVMQA